MVNFTAFVISQLTSIQPLYMWEINGKCSCYPELAYISVNKLIDGNILETTNSWYMRSLTYRGNFFKNVLYVDTAATLYAIHISILVAVCIHCTIFFLGHKIK